MLAYKYENGTKLSSLICCFVLTSSLIHAQTVYHVKAGAAGPSGLSWSEALGNLQQAIDSAQTGDQIWIATGTYTPESIFDTDHSMVAEDRERTFYLAKNIQIYGGFEGNESTLEARNPIANPVTLSGDLGSPLDTADNSYHIMYLDGASTMITRNCIIDGIIFQHGNASQLNFPHSAGSAIMMNGYGQGGRCNPLIRNCTIKNNYSSYAGAIYADGRIGEASPFLENCDFLANESYAGAAIYCNGYQGISSPVFLNCLFKANSSSYAGGAFFSYCNKGYAAPLLTNCKFSENTTTIGGAVYSSASEGQLDIRYVNCIFHSNIAHHKAGGIFNFGYLGQYTVAINNCTFYQNTGVDHGGALFNWYVQCNLTNSIFWDSADEIHNFEGGIVNMTYCIYEDEVPNNQMLTLPHHTSGSHNSDLNPKFVDPGSLNLRLQQNSPALNSGKPDTTGLFLPENDPDTQARVNGIIDRGAFENPLINCPDHIHIPAYYSPLKGDYQANQEIQLDENSLINSISTSSLSAPCILINPGTTVMLGGTLEISQAGCNP